MFAFAVVFLMFCDDWFHMSNRFLFVFLLTVYSFSSIGHQASAMHVARSVPRHGRPSWKSACTARLHTVPPWMPSLPRILLPTLHILTCPTPWATRTPWDRSNAVLCTRESRGQRERIRCTREAAIKWSDITRDRNPPSPPRIAFSIPRFEPPCRTTTKLTITQSKDSVIITAGQR